MLLLSLYYESHCVVLLYLSVHLLPKRERQFSTGLDVSDTHRLRPLGLGTRFKVSLEPENSVFS